MPWCANVPVFLDQPPPFILTHIRGHSFHFALSLFSSPCLCQNTKDILIFAFILTHISFSPGVCHKHKHYFQRQDKTIVSAIEISQVCYNTCSCKNKMQNWQTMCRGGICHSRRECKIFAIGVNFSRNNAVCYINESKKLHFILISSLKLLTYY